MLSAFFLLLKSAGNESFGLNCRGLLPPPPPPRSSHILFTIACLLPIKHFYKTFQASCFPAFRAALTPADPVFLLLLVSPSCLFLCFSSCWLLNPAQSASQTSRCRFPASPSSLLLFSNLFFIHHHAAFPASCLLPNPVSFFRLTRTSCSSTQF